MAPKWIVSALLAAFVAAVTIFFRIPIPRSGGYLNLGDIVIIFSGLYLGPRYGAFIGGVGSAVADAFGFPIFVIPTLLIKGVEGGLSGLAKGRPILGPLLGVIVMVGGYFVAEAFIFRGSIGLAAAVAELPFNVLQGAIGLAGGTALYVVIRRWTAEEGGPGGRNE